MEEIKERAMALGVGAVIVGLLALTAWAVVSSHTGAGDESSTGPDVVTVAPVPPPIVPLQPYWPSPRATTGPTLPQGA